MIFEQVINGVMLGMVYALIAVGYGTVCGGHELGASSSFYFCNYYHRRFGNADGYGDLSTFKSEERS